MFFCISVEEEVMKNTIKFLFLFSLIAQTLKAEDCPVVVGKYGNGSKFQSVACRTSISEKAVDDTSYRSVLLNDEGMIQVFSNFPGTTNSN